VNGNNIRMSETRTIVRLAEMQPDASDGNLFHDSLKSDYAVELSIPDTRRKT